MIASPHHTLYVRIVWEEIIVTSRHSPRRLAIVAGASRRRGTCLALAQEVASNILHPSEGTPAQYR